MVYVLIGNGFEEIEAVSIIDILRRGGVDVKTLGIGGTLVAGGVGIKIETDMRVEDADTRDVEMIVLPGGLGGVESIKGSKAAMDLIKTVYDGGKKVAAICAAPTVFGKMGILGNRRAICYPGLESKLTGAVVAKDEKVVVDGNVITSKAPGTAMDFGLKLVEVLKGAKTSEEVRDGLRYGL